MEWYKNLPSAQYEPDRLRAGDFTIHRDGEYAGPGFIGNGKAEISAHRNYNGSGKTAFGGADRWPAASMKVAFREGEFDKRNKFIEDLKTFVDKWIEENP